MANAPETPAILWKIDGENCNIFADLFKGNQTTAHVWSAVMHTKKGADLDLAGNQDGGRRRTLPCKP